MVSEVREWVWREGGSGESSSARARFLRPLFWVVKMESRGLVVWVWDGLEGRGRVSLLEAEVARSEVRDVAKVRFEAPEVEEDLVRGVALGG